MATLRSPTVKQFIEELKKFDPNSTIWFETQKEQFTPPGICGQKGYTVQVEEGSYRNNVYIAMKKG